MNEEHVWLSLGSNLCNPLRQITCAIHALSCLPNSKFIECSSYYRSKPLGLIDQPDFLNTVVAIKTRLLPEQLLDYIQIIESNQGRKRTKNSWESRTLDIDILLFGQNIIITSRLIIPHYDMFNREFMLYPLFELEPDIQFPDGTTIENRLYNLPINELKFWNLNN